MNIDKLKNIKLKIKKRFFSFASSSTYLIRKKRNNKINKRLTKSALTCDIEIIKPGEKNKINVITNDITSFFVILMIILLKTNKNNIPKKILNIRLKKINSCKFDEKVLISKKSLKLFICDKLIALISFWNKAKKMYKVEPNSINSTL